VRPNEAIGVGDRVSEHHRAVALARYYRDAEGLSILQIAAHLGRSLATVKAYFYNSTRRPER
jgi:DNA-binding NarL/FixJ family response regulator